VGPRAPSPAQATIDGEELAPVSPAAPHHGYGLRSREGGQLERLGRPRDLGEARSPDPRAPIRAPLSIEAERDAEEDKATQEQPGRIESGTGPTPLGLPEDRAAGTRPMSEAQGDVEAGQVRPTSTVTHDPRQTPTTSHKPISSKDVKQLQLNLKTSAKQHYDGLIDNVDVTKNWTELCRTTLKKVVLSNRRIGNEASEDQRKTAP